MLTLVRGLTLPISSRTISSPFWLRQAQHSRKRAHYIIFRGFRATAYGQKSEDWGISRIAHHATRLLRNNTHP